MASVMDAFKIAAKASSVSKGSSMNERDASTGMVFDGDTCEITCGGLFATCVIKMEMESHAKHRLCFSMKNEMINAIAQVYEMPDLAISGAFSGMHELDQVILSTPSVNLSIPVSHLWGGFTTTTSHDVDFIKIDRNSFCSALQSMPKLLQDSGEKKTMTALKMEAKNGTLLMQSADSALAVSVAIPCGDCRFVATLPFAAIAIITWVGSFESENECEVGLSDGNIVVKCGKSMVVIRQIATAFRDISGLIKSLSRKESISTTLVVSRILEASSTAMNVGCQSVRISLGSDGAIITAESVDGSVRVNAGCESPAIEVSASPLALRNMSECFGRLGFSDIKLSARKESLFFTASKSSVSVTACLAAMNVS